ncbi:hypothetical protein [Mucilaginibacter sp. L3T2-6]|uniref:hypothetical protein n=1 Tax=Mucilaginibacter sp. L3T2-6 TaxID=3062491 RepID=UPI002674FC38|nr:hypothetical protein [Mucilaginibacter sp. L3T2-6]MDO3641757.1 hypothetical protein [Mucilaginibacter sp. L3T2-6]MDV6214251.1 hypothetical protein [Mucilaginibacter sp. L3T2-6]
MDKTSTPEVAHWPAPQKIAFRFFFSFFLLIIVAVPNSTVPFYDGLYAHLTNVLHVFIPWIAKNIIHLEKPVTHFTGGSGDTTYDYILDSMTAIVALLVTVVWSYTGRKTAHYRRLFYWLMVILRYYVSFAMMIYGFSKVFKVQFPAPGINRLVEQVGDMSPMGLAWTYMGYSAAFNYIIGAAELLCCGLLLFRRTTTLGAMVGVVVISNIVAINYCFDVCVKLVSSTLLLMCLFILIPDRKRLTNFFFRNRDTPPADLPPHRFSARWKNIVLQGAKYALVLYMAYVNLLDIVPYYQKFGDDAPKPPLYGLYEVDSFVKNRDTLKPLITDTSRWRKFWVRRAGEATVKLMNDSLETFAFKPDTTQHIVTVHTAADTVNRFSVRYNLEKPGVLVLQGRWKNDSIKVRLKKVDLAKFRLISRGFHMINETPYNR